MTERLTKYNPETGQYEFHELAKTQEEFMAQRKAVIQKLGEYEDRAEGVKQSEIKWVNRPIAAQYATVTDEYGEKHYGKVCDRIENNPVGYCGECEKRLDDNFMNYCPNCGAKMKGDKND